MSDLVKMKNWAIVEETERFFGTEADYDAESYGTQDDEYFEMIPSEEVLLMMWEINWAVELAF